MDFRLLGALEVAGPNGPIELGGRKQRLVLAHLVLRAGRLVPAEELIDEIWGEEPPQSARSWSASTGGDLYQVSTSLGSEPAWRPQTG
jgi:DNA-binding SARP family transcriptional activator